MRNKRCSDCQQEGSLSALQLKLFDIIDNINSLKFLIVDRNLLGFDLLLGLNAIKEPGGVQSIYQHTHSQRQHTWPLRSMRLVFVQNLTKTRSGLHCGTG